MDEIIVRKANRVIRVSENELQKYLNNGYAVINRPTQPSEKVAEEVKFEAPAEPKRRNRIKK